MGITFTIILSPYGNSYTGNTASIYNLIMALGPWMTRHIFDNIDSGNDMSHAQCQATTGTNAALLSIGFLKQMTFKNNEIWIELRNFSL